MKRRQFLKEAAAVPVLLLEAGGAGAVPSGRAAAPRTRPESREAKEPLLRFLHLTDTHVHAGPSDPKVQYPLANEKMSWIVDAANRGNPLPSPDFVLHSGDMINGEPQSKGPGVLAPDFKRLKELIAPLRCPFYPCVGNHETQQQEGNPAYEGPYREAFGADRVHYTFRHSGLRFVVFNNSGAPVANAEAGKERNRWLRETLDAWPDDPKILCCHIPLVPLRDALVLRESFGFASETAHDEELLSIVEGHAGTVIAVLSGHLHLTGMIRQKGIYHIVPSGPTGFPCDYGYHYTVFPDRIQAQVGTLSKDLTRTDGGNIHGRPRHPKDFTDSHHATARLYQSGRRDERAFTIPLADKKRLGVG
ncbi:MAG: metallophosphoesterase [Armatimonadetes bacterium]|nr:metallophosphoesterase [Armatimonadota bacterium]